MFFFLKIFYIGKSIKIIQNTLKIEENFSDVPKQFGVGPKKLESVGFLETRHFFFFLALSENKHFVQLLDLLIIHSIIQY